MADLFTKNDYYFDPQHTRRPQEIVILLNNAFAIHLKEIGQRAAGVPIDQGEFEIQLLCPQGVFESFDTEEEQMTLAPMPNTYGHIMPSPNHPVDLKEATHFIRQAAKLEPLHYIDTPLHSYVLRWNVLHRAPSAEPQCRITQAWKTPINQNTGNPDPRLRQTQNNAWAADTFDFNNLENP